MMRITTTAMTPELKEKVEAIAREIIDLLMQKHGLAPQMAYGVLDHILQSYPEQAPRIMFRRADE